MSKRMELGERDFMVITAAVIGVMRSGMLTTTSGGVGNKEGMRGRRGR